jgi:predicted MFS family arabinose efflux permease
MRLMIGSLFRKMAEKKLLFISFGIIFVALLLFSLSRSVIPASAGLFLLGSGLAAGFPTMLGLVGNRYPDISGTAFSFVLVIGLLGNMLVNYIMGVVAENHGIEYLTWFTFVVLTMLIIIATVIFGRPRNKR